MSSYSCSVPDCTVSVTGRCVLSHPLESCPNVRIVTIDPDLNGSEELSVGLPLRAGNELGFTEVSDLMSIRYGRIVGVLGAFGTGKTCLISSTYLLAACGDLRPTFLFAGSATLRGFEARLHKLRSWTGHQLPPQIVDHTVLADPRQPGFLHLALRETVPRSRICDLFFTDLPGEWTTDLVNRADTAKRLSFLRRADAIVITVLGPLVLDRETQRSQLQFGRMLFYRLRDSIGIARDLPLIIAITRCDEIGQTVPPTIYSLLEAGQSLGFERISHIPIAAFSDRPGIPSGLGVPALLEQLVAPAPRPARHLDTPVPGRMFGRYRYTEETEREATA